MILTEKEKESDRETEGRRERQLETGTNRNREEQMRGQRGKKRLTNRGSYGCWYQRRYR